MVALTVREAGGDVTTASIIVDAPPEEVYALVTDYANWRQAFSDIESVTVKGGGRDDAKVRFRSRALDHTVTVQFDNAPPRFIRFRGIEGPPGGKARGEYMLTAIDNGRRTRVDATLYMDVIGPASWFVRDKTIRAMRQAKLARDLNDAAQWFARKRASA